MEPYVLNTAILTAVTIFISWGAEGVRVIVALGIALSYSILHSICCGGSIIDNLATYIIPCFQIEAQLHPG